MGEQEEQSNSTQLGPWYSIMVTLSPLSAVAARADMEWRNVTSVA